MSQAISESSSDEENEAQQPKRTRYECPEDFTSVSYAPCQSARRQSVFDENKELWLIKAPVNFDPRSLSGKKLPLVGLTTVKTGKAGATQQIFSVLGGCSTSTSLRLLTSDPSQPDTHLCAPAFSGVLNVSESYGDCSSNQGPIAVPAAPAPQLPDGLRQRYFPFGSSRPATAPAEEVVAEEATVPVRPVKMEPDHGQEMPRKRKKEKRIKVEQEEEEAAAVAVKVEPLDESMMAEQVTEERKKKKKKKKDKEREREKVEGVVDPWVRVKQEPVDRDEVDSESVHKKKKKKKIKTDIMAM
ncbi:CD3e molecule, epsilon associated protein [Alosa sapidissima]|uniref:CD3e molecule, epsilon associated protein n=1 Tax=Alosa sapidissima TaxID=34773 RepID=UPI001C0A34CC|nr:CD3e molecule, epsilon associated protein [Alosa sapidissima]